MRWGAIDTDDLERADFTRCVVDGVPYWTLRSGPHFELTLEPLVWERWAIALYDDKQQLVMGHKVEINAPVRWRS